MKSKSAGGEGEAVECTPHPCRLTLVCPTARRHCPRNRRKTQPLIHWEGGDYTLNRLVPLPSRDEAANKRQKRLMLMSLEFPGPLPALWHHGLP